MSPSKLEPGRAWTSSQVHSRGLATSPSIFRRQSARSTRGVGPAVSTGNPDSAYWPGGSRLACPAWSGGRRRLNPRDTNPPIVTSSRQPWHGPMGSVQRGSLVAMAELHVRRVFAAPEGTGGNPLGVFLDGPGVAEGRRQEVAADLGFSETVFVDDPAAGVVRIFPPAAELPFAGHPLVGTSWLLARERTAVTVLRPPAGEVPTFLDEDGVTWIR